ncbi:MAG: hypothetical protein ACRC4M_02355 [Mycoplasma sp.]
MKLKKVKKIKTKEQKRLLFWTITLGILSTIIIAFSSINIGTFFVKEKDCFEHSHITNFEESEDVVDQEMAEFYKNNVSSLRYEDGNSMSGGTFWNYPTPHKGDPKLNYYITNFHVLDECLINRNSLREEIVFLGLNKDNEYIRMNDVNIYKTDYYNNKVLGINVDYTKDMIIFSSTTNIFPDGDEDLNFMDTKKEYDWLIENVKNDSKKLTYFLGGFPVGDNGNEYLKLAKISNPPKRYKPLLMNSTQYNPLLFLFNNSTPYHNGEYNFQNNAKQLMIPGLFFENGSSGSLLTVLYNGKPMIVGIYWGGLKNLFVNFLGIIDLIYQPYEYNMLAGINKMPAYDMTPKGI